ncbi:MAG: hypothetical protein AAGF20_00065 [Pseudomonadota bacterium]
MPANAFDAVAQAPKEGDSFLKNAFGLVANMVAPDAYQRGKQRFERDAFANALSAGDYDTAATHSARTGDTGGAFQLMQYGQDQKRMEAEEAERQRMQKIQGMMALTQNMMQIPEDQRQQWAMDNWSQIAPIVGNPDFMDFWQGTDGDVSDAALQQDMATLRVQAGMAPPEVEAPARLEPIKVGDSLIDPYTYEVLYQAPAEGPAEMTPYQRAQTEIDRQRLVLDRDKFDAEQSDQIWGDPDIEGMPNFGSQFEGLPVYKGQFMTVDAEAGGFNSENILEGLSPDKMGRPSGREPTVFDKQRDEDAAKLLAEWQLSGQSQAGANLERIRQVIHVLGNSDNITGPVVGSYPEWLRPIVAADSVAAQDTVGQVIQQSLRSILGGQFAEREGENLLKRSYNPQLSEAENAKRLMILHDELAYRALVNDYALQYSDRYGTLQGFNGYLGDFNPFGSADFFPDKADVGRLKQRNSRTRNRTQSISDMSDEDLLGDLGFN